MVGTVPCVATARTRDSAGGAMAKKLGAGIRCEGTERPELFEMCIAPEEWDRELVDQQERDGLPAR